MIYQIKWEDGRIDNCTAESILHLLKSYDADYFLFLQEIESVTEISNKEAKKIMVRNPEYDEDVKNDMPEEISLFDLGGNSSDFMIIASTEF